MPQYHLASQLVAAIAVTALLAGSAVSISLARPTLPDDAPGVMACAFALALLLGVLLIVRISRPLGRLTGVAVAIGEGDLAPRASLGNRRDEIGTLGRAVDRIADQLAATVGRLGADIEAHQSGDAERHEGEARFRAVFEHAPVGIQLLDSQARILEANRFLLDMLGYDEEEIRGLTFRDIGHPDDQVHDAASVQSIRSGSFSSLYRSEKRYRHKDGHAVWVQITGVPVLGPDHKPEYFVSMVENLTERKRAEAALLESQHRNVAMLNAVVDGIFSVDADGCLTEFNPAAEHMFGKARFEMLGRRLSDMLDLPASGAGEWRPEDLQALVGRRVETIARRHDGSTFPVELAIAAFTVADRQEFTGYIRDITDRKRAEAALAHQALHDALTGLPNRSLLRERMDQALQDVGAGAPAPSLLLMDLDGFKEVNDSLGHQAGDDLLRQVAARVQAAIRPTDLVARLGGDEFAVLLPATPAEGATQVAWNILAALEPHFSLDGQLVNIGASVGLACCPLDRRDPTTLLRHADVAMYTAKHSRTRLARYTAEQDQHGSDRLTVAAELREALSRDELVLHYQPKVELATGRIVRAEALVRWHHPRQGLLPPDRFIPLAEQTGLIQPLGRWVLEAALRQCSTWREGGLAIPVAVNLSVQDLHDTTLPSTVAALLVRHSLPPEMLVLEITETGLLSDPERALEVLQGLRAQGVRIAIDDFGAGTAGLGYLKRLPVDQLKIDRSFIHEMLRSASDAAIVRATSIEVTADIYLHSLDVQVRDTARSVEKALSTPSIESSGTCPTCGRPKAPDTLPS